MRKILASLIAFLILHSASAQLAPKGVSQPDPFVIIPPEGGPSTAGGNLPVGYYNTNGLTYRPQSYDPSKRNLVLIVMGQSNCENVNPSLYVPVNSSVIDQFSIYDGASYPISGPLNGATLAPQSTYGPGNVGARLADQFVANAIFDHVIVASTCIGGSSAQDWASGSIGNRVAVIFARLKQRGFVPGASGVTFAISWWQGEADGCIGTTQSNYILYLQTVLQAARSAGFTCSSCRFFVNVETWECGPTNPTIEAAQTALAGTLQFFAGGNVDTLGLGDRQADGIHFNDTGAAAAATLVYNAMHASGAPF